ncbi:type 4a pilus biogenesis protein PilO [Halomonas sp.]|uniref:type 4a pilus biogenesis protein PilO n=1 Tax=Halomonas sp. TaxID=1486246 RepID=UPI000C97A7EB|nr:type 4a pilus biogenesis protein PilO [Halomonas sp.]MAR74488.1 pilus assembly protein PilO [Halomonas sp.]|tara:strand:+ start:616 stop:1305 length:690 start_codon:yes stop_codon:yes gene_type:complete
MTSGPGGNAGWGQRWHDEWRRLKALDWRRLELDEAGRWPTSLRTLVAILAFVLALAAMVVGYLHPLSQRLVELQRQEREVIGDFEDRARELAELDRLKRLLVDLDQRVSERRRMLPDGADIPSLLEGIGLVAKRRGLSLEALELRPARALALYVERPFDLRVRGDYHAIGGFVADLANLPRLVTLHDFSLSPVDGGLELRALAQTYSIGDGAHDGEATSGSTDVVAEDS